jgi:cation diffusion facilitator family transporter
MTFAGFEAGRAAIVRLLEGSSALEIGWPAVALVLSAGVKAGMFGIIRNIARRATSPTLAAAAKDNLADVLTSSAAFVGILGSQFIAPIADPVAGCLVAIWILKSALEVWQENLTYLTGGGASEQLRGEIVNAASAVRGVERVHQVITEHAGPELVADLHINVDGNLPLFDAHTISDRVQERVEAIDGIDRAYVHLEPCEVIPREDAD